MIVDVGMRPFQDVVKESYAMALRKPFGRNAVARYANEDGSPCCFFGHVLNGLGVDVAALPQTTSMGMLDWQELGFSWPDSAQLRFVRDVQFYTDRAKSFWISAIVYSGFRLT